MEHITVREAIKDDFNAIGYIHRNCDDPWHDEDECIAWITKRIDRGFYIQAGFYGEKLVGHGEWIISDESDGKYLYLGMLQVDSDYQKMGVGREMIEDGIRYAKENCCKFIATIPDVDTGSFIFYEKCGFMKSKALKSCTLPTVNYQSSDIDKYIIDNVPFDVIHDNEFLFGLAQASSRHMWEVCNQKPATDDRLTPAIKLEDGTYIQMSYFESDNSALVLCWTSSVNYDNIIKNALCFGNKLGLTELDFLFYEEYTKLFTALTDKIDDYNYEILKPV